MEQNNNTFNDINKMIQDLEYYAGDEDASSDLIMQVVSKLGVQFENAANSEWLKADLNDFILVDNDVLDFIDVNQGIVSDNFRSDVETVQHAIINFFGV